jgi:hypothetical protein
MESFPDRRRGADLLTIPRRPVREEQIVQRDLKAAAQTGVGELFQDKKKDFVSADGRVTAIVCSSAGGELSAVVSTSAHNTDLRGARISIRFFTDAGTELTADKRLWEDEADPKRLAAFFDANQTKLKPPNWGATPETKTAVNLGFEFEVHPSSEPGG